MKKLIVEYLGELLSLNTVAAELVFLSCFTFPVRKYSNSQSSIFK